MARAMDLSGLGHGLTTEKQLHIGKLLHDYDPNLSLRRIPERDPAFRPPKVFGVWEENVAPGQTNWVFTLAEMSIDERVLARIVENDMRRQGASAQFAKMMAIQGAAAASKAKKEADQMAEREEEMIGIGRLAARKHTFRHVLRGQQVVIGDTIRPVRKNL